MNRELEVVKKIPETVEELDAWLKLHFKYVKGEFRAWYELPDCLGNVVRRSYHVIGLTHELPHFSDCKLLPRELEHQKIGAERSLVQSFHQLFVDHKAATGLALPTLVDRAPLNLSLYEEAELDYSVDPISRQAFQDGTEAVPFGWDLDIAADVYRPVTRRYHKLRIYMRFDIPELASWVLEQSLYCVGDGMPFKSFEDVTSDPYKPLLDSKPEAKKFSERIKRGDIWGEGHIPDVDKFSRIGSLKNPLNEESYALLVASGYHHNGGFTAASDAEGARLFRDCRPAMEPKTTHVPLACLTKIAKI